MCVLKWVGMRNKANKWGIACNIPSIGWNAKPAHSKRPFTRESFKKHPKNFSTKSEAANRKWSNLTDHCPNYFKIQWSFLSISLFSDCKLPNQTIVICQLYSYSSQWNWKAWHFFSFDNHLFVSCKRQLVKEIYWDWFVFWVLIQSQTDLEQIKRESDMRYNLFKQVSFGMNGKMNRKWLQNLRKQIKNLPAKGERVIFLL